MKYHIIEKEAFTIVGKAIRVNMENKQDITNFWIESNQNGFNEKLGRTAGPCDLYHYIKIVFSL
jgi:predicted transcriptional regulator YdeE